MNQFIQGEKSVAQQLWKDLFPLVNYANFTMVKFLGANFGVKEFHPFTKMYVDSNSTTEIIEIMNNILGKKSDNEIFKFEPELEVNNQTNTNEEEVNPYDDNVSDLLRDKMVFDLVALEQSQ